MSATRLRNLSLLTLPIWAAMASAKVRAEPLPVPPAPAVAEPPRSEEPARSVEPQRVADPARNDALPRVAEPAQSQEQPRSKAQPLADPSHPEAHELPLDPWILESRDRKFTLRIGAQLQFRYTASDAEKKSDKQSFQLREARPQLRASIGKPWITVFIQPELANVPQLLDLELTVQPYPALGFKVGQFLTPFSRTFYTPVPKLLFPDFSIANNAFRADRETGAMVFGTPFSGLFEYYLGAFNGNRINQNGNDDDKLLAIARVAVNPLGAVAYDETPLLAGASPLRFALGLNGYYGKVPPTAPSAPAFPLPATNPALVAATPAARDKTATVGADVALRYWLATLQGEFYYRHLDKGVPGPDIKAKGGYVHASSFVYWPYLELAARVSWVDPNERVKRDQTLAYEALANVYVFANNLKLNLRYTHFDNPAPAAGQAKAAANQFVAQTQFYF